MRVEKLKAAYDVEIQNVHFPLHPDTPMEGKSLEELFAGRDYDPEAMYARMKGLMDEEGLPYAQRTHTYNSRLAQELGKWADTQPGGDAIHMKLYQAYFVDQKNIADIDLLVGIAYSDERAQRFDFTAQTLVSNWGVLYRQPDVVIDSITDIVNIRVAMMTGTIHARQLLDPVDRFGISIETVETASYRDALAAVDDGRADAAAVSRLYGLLYSPGFRVTATAIVYNPVEVRFAGPKGADPRFLAAIDT